MENVDVWLGPSGVGCGHASTWSAWPHHVTGDNAMLPIARYDECLSIHRYACDQDWWWHEDSNCMMHSSLEMHFALGASSNIDKTVPGSGLSNSYIDHAVLGTWTPGIKETINMVQTTDSSCKSGFLPIECSVPVKVPISRPSSARRSSLALCSSLNTALGFLTDYFGRVQLTQCRADLRACF